MKQIQKAGKVLLAIALVCTLLFANTAPVMAATVTTNQVKKVNLLSGASKTYSFTLKKQTKITLTYECYSSTDSPADTLLTVNKYKDSKHKTFQKTYLSTTQIFNYGKSYTKTMTLPKGYYTFTAKNKSEEDYKFKLTLYSQVDTASKVILDSTATVQYNTPYTLVAKDEKGNAINPSKLTWISSDTTIATVNKGVVTGITPGTCMIAATLADGTQAQCSVTVKDLGTLQKLQVQDYYANVYQVSDGKAYVKFYNNSSKAADYVVLYVLQFNNAKKLIKSSFEKEYYINDTVSANSTVKYYFDVDSKTKYATAFVHSVSYEDGSDDWQKNSSLLPSWEALYSRYPN